MFLTEAAQGLPGFSAPGKSGTEGLISGTGFPETRGKGRKVLSFSEVGQPSEAGLVQVLPRKHSVPQRVLSLGASDALSVKYSGWSGQSPVIAPALTF